MPDLTRYWKLIGLGVGFLVGLLVTFGLLPEDSSEPVQTAILALLSAFGVYIAPKNTETP